MPQHAKHLGASRLCLACKNSWAFSGVGKAELPATGDSAAKADSDRELIVRGHLRTFPSSQALWFDLGSESRNVLKSRVRIVVMLAVVAATVRAAAEFGLQVPQNVTVDVAGVRA
jgi:hypothetical protein